MKIKKLLTTLTILMVVLIAGCRKDDYVEKVGKCPLVVTDPVNGAVDVPFNKIVRAIFNEKMNTTTINQSSFILMQGTALVTGTVSAQDSTASFTPSAPLMPFTIYKGTIKSSVKDLVGNALQADYVWTFTTIPLLTLSANQAAWGTVSGGGAFPQGSVVTVTATPNVGYVFVNWTENGTVVSSVIAPKFENNMINASNAKEVSTSSSYQFKMNGNRTLVANFTAVVLGNFAINLSSNPSAGGTTGGAGSFIENSVKTVTASPNTGYTFFNWTEGGLIVSTSASYQLAALKGNKTLVANFLIDTHTLTVNAIHGTVTKNPNQATYDYGTTVQLTLVPDAGYVFSSWSGDASGSSNPLTVTMNSDKNITANFTPITYTLNVTATNGSVVKIPDQTTYNSGSTVQLTPTPNTGFTFTSWSGDATGSASPLTVIMNGNKNITANFTANVSGYTLNVTAVNGTVAKNPDQLNYASGSNVVLTPTANSGYTFSSWSGDATGSSNPLTVNMNANKNITANFIPSSVQGPGAVNLGTAADFTILAKTGISTIGVTSITGNIGVSPAAATAITGFSLIMDATNQFSTSLYVVGKVYAAAYAVPTPAKLTTAVNDMQTAFTTANGMTTNVIVELGAGNISGMTLAPGLYKWSTGLLITNAGVTLSGGPNDTWVFQVAQGLTVSNSAIIHLSGGAQAKNIFWTTGSNAVIGSNVDFSGNIMSQTLISLNTGAKVTGRLLAQTAVTLNTSIVVLP